MFARFFAILGVDSEHDSFAGLFIVGRYFLSVYENSVGNINTPEFTVWENGSAWSQSVVIVIWLIWFMN